MSENYFVYLLASKRDGTLYTGVTNDLVKRVWHHKEGLENGFTKNYGVKMLVWYDVTPNIEAAIVREKQIKKWHRRWKIELIEKTNKNWRDLYEEIAV